MAYFDKAIPPGGEGKVTLKLNLKGYQGVIKKSATVFSNDPRNSRVMLSMQGTIKSLIEVRPANAVSFRGSADQLKENNVDIISTTASPFHIEKTESNLDEKIAYQLETLEDGKHYRLKVSNRLKQGSYNGFIKAYTNLQQKPEVVIRISGYIEGDVSVKPQTLLVGKLAPQQPVRLGKVIVSSNKDKQFKITKLTYDERLIQVAQQPIPNEQGVSLEITPQLANVPTGARQQIVLTIETDLEPTEKYDVQVHVLNLIGPPPSATAPRPASVQNPPAQPKQATEASPNPDLKAGATSPGPEGKSTNPAEKSQ